MDVLDLLRDSLLGIRTIATVVDEALAAGGFANARDAARDSELRRAAWAGAIAAPAERDDTTSVA